MVQYSTEFKQKAFKVFSDHKDLISIMNAMEKNRTNLVRFILEDLVDDPELYEYVSKGDELVAKVRLGKLNDHAARVSLYADFMDLLNVELDKTVTILTEREEMNG